MTTLTIASMYAIGTDCEDCGPVGYSNFTVVNDDNFWDDDDYFDFNDAEFLGKYLSIYLYPIYYLPCVAYLC